NQLLAENLFEYSRKASLYAATTDSLHQLRKTLWDAWREKGSGRIEWFVVWLLEVSRFIRNNVAVHVEIDRDVPRWMDERRKWLKEQPWCARLMLLCQLHAALELQHLWQNSGLKPEEHPRD